MLQVALQVSSQQAGLDVGNEADGRFSSCLSCVISSVLRFL